MKYKLMNSEITTSVIMGLLFIFLGLFITTILYSTLTVICKSLGLIINWNLSFLLGILSWIPAFIFSLTTEEYLDNKYSLTEDLGWGDIAYRTPYEILNNKKGLN